MKSVSLPVIAILFMAVLFQSCKPTGSDQSNETKTGQQAVDSSGQASNDRPDMIVQTIDNKQIDLRNQEGKLVLVMFQPDCDHCQRETDQVKENLEAFKHYKVFYISSASLPEISSFADKYGLNVYNNFTFAHASIPEVINAFGPIPSPTVYIYSKEGKLIKALKGETDIDEIKKYL